MACVAKVSAWLGMSGMCDPCMCVWSIHRTTRCAHALRTEAGLQHPTLSRGVGPSKAVTVGRHWQASVPWNTDPCLREGVGPTDRGWGKLGRGLGRKQSLKSDKHKQAHGDPNPEALLQAFPGLWTHCTLATVSGPRLTRAPWEAWP